LAALLVGAGTAGIVLASSGSDGEGASAGVSATAFAPGKIKGKWTGHWENTTFDTTGGIRANVQVRPGDNGSRMVPLADFGGHVFGCSNPPAAVESLHKGSNGDSWNANGFRLTDISPAFGNMHINYNFATRVFTGSGKDPSCNEDITYTIRGKLNPGGFHATVRIDLGSQVAVTQLTAKKN
jgi:hypothetical protein